MFSSNNPDSIRGCIPATISLTLLALLAINIPYFGYVYDWVGNGGSAECIANCSQCLAPSLSYPERYRQCAMQGIVLILWVILIGMSIPTIIAGLYLYVIKMREECQRAYKSLAHIYNQELDVDDSLEELQEASLLIKSKKRRGGASPTWIRIKYMFDSNNPDRLCQPHTASRCTFVIIVVILFSIIVVPVLMGLAPFAAQLTRYGAILLFDSCGTTKWGVALCKHCEHYSFTSPCIGHGVIWLLVYVCSLVLIIYAGFYTGEALVHWFRRCGGALKTSDEITTLKAEAIANAAL